MTQEMGLEVRRTRFVWRGFLYPLHFVIFEDPKKLGYFNADSYQIGLHKKLMYLAKDEVIDNILRHELAHFYTFLLYGKQFSGLLPHGPEFKGVCRQFHWAENVSLAYSNLEEDNLKAQTDPDFERVKERIQKLLALSSSDNPHEAENATIKANKLLVEYNLKDTDLQNTESEEEAVVMTVAQAKKLNSSLNAFYDILSRFYVQPVFNRNTSGVKLDVVGSRLNVEMAKDLCDYLEKEFEKLWQRTRRENPNLKGLRAKNSYIKGVSRGFCAKLDYEKGQMKATSAGKDLVLLEKRLIRQIDMAFPRLSRQASSSAALNQDAMTLGHNDGQNLDWKKRINSKESSKSKTLKLLGF